MRTAGGRPRRRAPGPRGSGLQAERTALAWQRTTFGLLANGGLFAWRAAGGEHTLPDLVLAGGLLVLAVVVAAYGHARERSLLALPPGAVPRSPRRLALLGWLVVAACAGGVVVLSLPSG
jgi:uncharacterized membrane protein YidH (DUF202 family)